MEERAVTIVVEGLTHLEADELGSQIQRAGGDLDSTLQVQSDAAGVSGTRRGEPFTVIAFLAVSQITLTALAVYLGKGRARDRRKLKLRHSRPDGETVEIEVEVDTSSEEAVKSDLFKAAASIRIPLPKVD